MICTSFGNVSFNELMELLPSTEMAEIRMDLLHLTDEEVAKIFSSHPILIATCRPDTLGHDEQKRLLRLAIESGATLVDLEVEADPSFKMEMINFAKAANCKVIISYHNYVSTPSTEEMNQIVSAILKEGAHLAKVATFANSQADAARVLSLYGQHKQLLAIAMGEHGKITRVAAPLLGAPFTFAAPNEKATAAGQLSASEMKAIYGIINRNV